MQVEKNTGAKVSDKFRFRHLTCAYSMALGYIHQSGIGYTADRNQAWVGNRQQFAELCARFDHDPKNFELFPVSFLTRLLTSGNSC